MTIILDGKAVRDKRKESLVKQIDGLDRAPNLAIIQLGDREDSTAYIKQKQKFGEAIGANVEVKWFPEDTVNDVLYKAIDEYSTSPLIDGIIVQLPLPEHIDVFSVIEQIDPRKDVDGLHSVNTKKLQAGDLSGMIPATAKGIVSLLDAYDIEIKGKHAVVVGRSMLVGRPTAMHLLARDATVTIAHSKTTDPVSIIKESDILVVAAGHPSLITAEYVHDKQVVVDVGINLVSGDVLQEEIPGRTFVGDVDFDGVKDHVAAISPVPGGVGPMTVLSLFENLAAACARRRDEM